MGRGSPFAQTGRWLVPRLRAHNAPRYTSMSVDFEDAETERVWLGEVSRRLPPGIQAIARRKLRMLDAAASLDDLRAPPGNRVERLRGACRAAQHPHQPALADLFRLAGRS